MKIVNQDYNPLLEDADEDPPQERVIQKHLRHQALCGLFFLCLIVMALTFLCITFASWILATFAADSYPPEQIHIALGQTPDTIAFTCM